MMPFSKEKNRRIYVTALIISFLLIVGSIYLHLRQKTHLGRMSFNIDRDRVKPTSGVDTTTWMDDYDSQYVKVTEENFNTDEDDTNVDNDILEASSPEDDDEEEDDDEKPTEYKDIFQQHTNEDQEDDDIKETSSDNDDDDDMPYKNSQEFWSHDYNNNEDINEYNDDDLDEDDMAEIEEKASMTPNSSMCFRCLCMTVNGCQTTFCGSGNPCGIFRISKSYWIEGGKPTIAGGSTNNEDQDYLTCVNDDMCSTTVIRQYYNQYKQDCNKDGVFDCKDQIALHLLGPSGCLTQNLSSIQAKRMKTCFMESNLENQSYSDEEEYYL